MQARFEVASVPPANPPAVEEEEWRGVARADKLVSSAPETDMRLELRIPRHEEFLRWRAPESWRLRSRLTGISQSRPACSCRGTAPVPSGSRRWPLRGHTPLDAQDRRGRPV